MSGAAAADPLVGGENGAIAGAAAPVAGGVALVAGDVTDCDFAPISGKAPGDGLGVSVLAVSGAEAGRGTTGDAGLGVEGWSAEGAGDDGPGKEGPVWATAGGGPGRVAGEGVAPSFGRLAISFCRYELTAAFSA